MIRFRLWRLQSGLTQGEAAAQLGLGLSTLALLEKGRLIPTQSQLELLRRAFGTETDSLFDLVQERVGAAS
jgi:transcriptional regulator with XRE-family HTH domain